MNRESNTNEKGDAGLKAYVLLTPVVLDLGDHPESDRLQDPWPLKKRKAPGGDLWAFLHGQAPPPTGEFMPRTDEKKSENQGENCPESRSESLEAENPVAK